MSTLPDRQQVNRVSGFVLLFFAIAALVAVSSGYAYGPQPDEGAAAHIFQLSIAALVPATALFLATADRQRRFQNGRLLAWAAGILAVAFGALYYLEHFR